MVTLTERASSKVREIIAERQLAPDAGLRVYVKPGGCSGFSYGLALDHEREEDVVVEAGDLKVFIDPMSAQFLKGAEVDYKDALMGGGFAIQNPNAVRTCGCGSSFRTADQEGAPQEC